MVRATLIVRDRRDLDAALRRYEQITEWPLIIAAVLFLVSYATPIIWPHLSHPVIDFSQDMMLVTWAFFGVDFVIRFALSRDRVEFFKTNIIDFLSIVLPVLRPLRMLRLVAALSIFERFGIQNIRQRMILYLLSFIMLVTFCGALTVTQAERGIAGSPINSFGDGIWWAFVTVTTTGYGDYAPVSLTGRVIGVILMMLGVLFMGAVAASLASWLVERSVKVDVGASREGEVEVNSLLEQIDSLNGQVQSLGLALHQHAALIREDKASHLSTSHLTNSHLTTNQHLDSSNNPATGA